MSLLLFTPRQPCNFLGIFFLFDELMQEFALEETSLHFLNFPFFERQEKLVALPLCWRLRPD